MDGLFCSLSFFTFVSVFRFQVSVQQKCAGKLAASLSLIPAFSPRRRRIFRRLFENPAIEFAG
jgi:hypothetical protein